MTHPTWIASILIILMFILYAPEQADSAEPPLILNLGFESGTLDGWKQIRTNLPELIQAHEPVREGEYAIKSYLDGAGWGVRGGERNEVRAEGSNDLSLPFGEYWYAFSVYLPESWVPDTQWEMIAQFHTDKLLYAAQPAMAFAMSFPSDGSSKKRTNWTIINRWDNRLNPSEKSGVVQTFFDIGPYETGKWTDFVINVRWAWDHGQGGFLKIWKDGQLVIDEIKPTCHRADGVRIPYFKMGIYKSSWSSNEPTPEVQSRTAYFDSFRMAGAQGSYDLVVPGGRVAPPKPVTSTVVD